MQKPEHEIILADTPDLIEQSKQVRIAVFVDEQKFPLETEIDEYDEPGASSSLLLRLLPSKEPIGVVRVVLPKLKIGRLCVLQPYRKHKFGSDLMVKAHELAAAELKATQRPEAEIALHSQLPVKAFYSRLGYLPVGEEFDEEGAPHQKMVLKIVAA